MYGETILYYYIIIMSSYFQPYTETATNKKIIIFDMKYFLAEKKIQSKN